MPDDGRHPSSLIELVTQLCGPGEPVLKTPEDRKEYIEHMYREFERHRLDAAEAAEEAGIALRTTLLD